MTSVIYAVPVSPHHYHFMCVCVHTLVCVHECMKCMGVDVYFKHLSCSTILICVYVSVHACMHNPHVGMDSCGHQMTTFGTWFFFPPWDPGTELRSSGFGEGFYLLSHLNCLLPLYYHTVLFLLQLLYPTQSLSPGD